MQSSSPPAPELSESQAIVRIPKEKAWEECARRLAVDGYTDVSREENDVKDDGGTDHVNADTATVQMYYGEKNEKWQLVYVFLSVLCTPKGGFPDDCTVVLDACTGQLVEVEGTNCY